MKSNFIQFNKEEIFANNKNISIVNIEIISEELTVLNVVFNNGTLLNVRIVKGSYRDPNAAIHTCTTKGRSIDYRWGGVGRLIFINSIKNDILEHINVIDAFVTREKKDNLSIDDIKKYTGLFN